MTRRLLLAALTAAILSTTIGASAVPLLSDRSRTTTTRTRASATQHRFVGPERVPSCRFRYFDGDVAFSKFEVGLTIRCAVRRWPVIGGVDLALCIARRESGLSWYADNPTSSASGVYQFVEGTWRSQVSARAEFMRLQELQRSVWNARSNVLVAIRAAHGAGWGPWGGGC